LGGEKKMHGARSKDIWRKTARPRGGKQPVRGSNENIIKTEDRQIPGEKIYLCRGRRNDQEHFKKSLQ